MRAVSTLAPPVSIEHSLISPRDSITRVKSDAPLGHRCSQLVISSPVSVVQRSVMVWPSSARRILSEVTSLCARWAQPSDTVMFRPSALPRTSPAGGPEGIVVGTLSAGAEPPDESREWSSDPHTRQPPKPGPRSLRRQHTPASTCDLRAAEDPRWRSARPKVADLVGFGLQSRSAMGCPWFDSFSCRPRRVRLARADRNLDTLRRSISRTLAMAAERPEYSANWDGGVVDIHTRG